MLRRLTRTALLAAAMAAVTATATTPAHAVVDDPVRSPKWVTATCATGALSHAGRDTQGAAMVLGHAEACSPHVADSSFAIAVYHLGDPKAVPFARVGAARYYRDGERRYFGIDVYTMSEKEAVCLVAGPEHRLACAMLRIKPGGAITMEPLTPTDPAVSRSVRFGHKDPAGGHGKPACLTCF